LPGGVANIGVDLDNILGDKRLSPLCARIEWLLVGDGVEKVAGGLDCWVSWKTSMDGSTSS
jgi:hypothetical protein